MPARVRKGIYGLLNGPKLWNNHVSNQLQMDDSVLCLLDSCTGKFYDWQQEERHGGPKLVGLRPFNIDDFLLDGEDHRSVWQAAKASLENAWQWSPWEKDELKITVVDFCQLPYGFIHMSQMAYLKDAEAISFSPACHCERGSAATEKESLMLCWVDAAWANWVDDSFTGGFLIDLALVRILDGHEVNTSSG